MIFDRARAFLLRWRIVVRVAAIAIPFLFSFALGLVWLRENGFLLEFTIACLVIGFLTYISLNLPIWFRRSDDLPDEVPNESQYVEANPDWTNDERRAYDAAQALISKRLKSALPPEDIQPFALEVIRTVAQSSGDAGKGELDFTIPEALLLVERVSSRLRADLRTHLSISDRVSVGTLFWLWKNRERAKRLFGLGHGAYRVYRVTAGLPVAVAREALDLVTSGNSELLTGEMQAIAQRILFEEVAKAATELYSGRLGISDAELLDSILEDASIDRQRLAEPDAPLRIAVTGQVSAGKSSLINALLGQEAAETDMPPTTDRDTAYGGEIAGLPCTLVDLPGLDGSKSATEKTLREADRCDILVWAVSANRPGREIDRITIEGIREHFRRVPGRRVPPLIGAVTFCDKMAGEDWPYPEHQIPIEVQARIGDAVNAIASETGLEALIPVSLDDPEWNVAALRQKIAGSFFDGIGVQRNRVRLTRKDKSLGREAIDTAQGITKTLRSLGRHASERYRRSGDD